jgi:molybdopterin/thiamine biosynthesis adenylyltransferase
VHPFNQAWVTGSSPSHIAFELKYLREFFRRCDEESLVFGFVHNHPSGFPTFSDTDEDNERTLLKALTNRNGTEIHFVALLWTNKEWRARIRHGRAPQDYQLARHVLVTSRPLQLFRSEAPSSKDEPLFARQAAAFGGAFTTQLQSLRLGVVGAGGTGTSTATLLARAGVGELVIFDADKVGKSNLNRLRGATTRDVGKNKARVLADYIRSIGMPGKVVAFDTLIDRDPVAIDALSSCDLIFGCTDDQIGREVLNTAVYVYAQPFIDVGLGGQISQATDGRPYLRYHHGRVSTILPEEGECLFCQGVINDVAIQHEYALRDKPNITHGEARERYLAGGAEQAPGVGPFTSAVADYGVATLFDLVRPFRKFPVELRWDAFLIDFVRMHVRSTQEKNDIECPYCRKRDYLLLREQYRLNRPMLGKRDATN